MWYRGKTWVIVGQWAVQKAFFVQGKRCACYLSSYDNKFLLNYKQIPCPSSSVIVWHSLCQNSPVFFHMWFLQRMYWWVAIPNESIPWPQLGDCDGQLLHSQIKSSRGSLRGEMASLWLLLYLTTSKEDEIQVSSALLYKFQPNWASFLSYQGT